MLYLKKNIVHCVCRYFSVESFPKLFLIEYFNGSLVIYIYEAVYDCPSSRDVAYKNNSSLYVPSAMKKNLYYRTSYKRPRNVCTKQSKKNNYVIQQQTTITELHTGVVYRHRSIAEDFALEMPFSYVCIVTIFFNSNVTMATKWLQLKFDVGLF